MASKLGVLSTFSAVLVLHVIGEVTQNEDGSEGTISFSPPTLNDEEAHSMHIPDHLKCDACTAVAYQFSEKFKAAHSKRKSLKRLPESDILNLAEDVCDGKELTNYGVKEVKRVKRLSGPGLEAEETPGIMQGGGKWPDRMQRMCHLFVEGLDEENIYNAYLSKTTTVKQFLCENDENPGLSDNCLPQKQQRNKKLKKKRDEF